MPKEKVTETNLYYVTGNGHNQKKYLKSQSMLAMLNQKVNSITFDKFGDKLQAFLDENDIDLDLRTCEGEDRKALFVDYKHTTKPGSRPACCMKDIDAEVTKADRNQSDRMIDTLKGIRGSVSGNPLTSTLYVFKKGEDSPRIVYYDSATDSIKATEPISRINTESLKPQKPGIWARFCHALNKNWYSEEFNRYERETERYDAFVGNAEKNIKSSLNATKALFEDEVSHWPQDAIEEQAKKEAEIAEKKRVKLVEAPKVYTELQNRTNRIMDEMLGEKATGSQELLSAKVYKEESYVPEALEYPETVFRGHDIALLGYAALSQPEICSRREENLDLGLSMDEKAKRNIVHYTDDIFFIEGGGSGRAGGDTAVGAFGEVRKMVKDALKDYSMGNKAGIARLLGDGIKMQSFQFKASSCYNVKDVHMAEILKDTMALLNKDPDLMKLSGLSEENVVTANGIIRYGEINKKAIDGAAALADTGRNLTQQEKELLVNDVIMAEAIDAVNTMEFENNSKILEKRDGERAQEIQKSAKNNPDAFKEMDALLARQFIGYGERDSEILKVIGKDTVNHEPEMKYMEKLNESPMVQKLKSLDRDALTKKIAGGFKEEAKELQSRLSQQKNPAPSRNTVKEMEKDTPVIGNEMGRNTI